MKIGRNEPCTCGSGKKYKKCCLNKKHIIPPPTPPDLKQQIERMQAMQAQVQKQQGFGRPIISEVFQGYRFVATGSCIHYSKDWKTFHDFLLHYIKTIMGEEWGSGELKKPEQEQHPIIQWYVKACKHITAQRKEGVEIQSVPMTGAIFALLMLSYNLFLLEHNLKIQERIITRLKNKQQFQGALYETYVCAVFIRAGFKLELENEDDPSSSHCEFTAAAPEMGEKYSIEAKSRQPFKAHVGIGKQLGKALHKNASYKRIIFIDVNIPKLMEKMHEIDKELRDRESSQDDDWKNAPPAYVFITNHSFAYDLGSIQFERMGFAFGFKIDYFKGNTRYTSLRDARLARDKHMNMVKLIKSMREQDTIPVTFDGDIPEFSFNKDLKDKRLLIGNKYLIPNSDGKEVVGILESASIIIEEKVVYGSYLLENGKRIICTVPASEEEIEAYKKHPDTFFGVIRPEGQKANNPLELYDFFYHAYKKTPREKLIEFMKDWPNVKELNNLDTEELRIIFCEASVYFAMQDKKQSSSA